MLKIPQVMAIMPFHRRGRMSLRPVNRIKHVVDAQGGALLGVNVFTTLAVSSDTPDLATTTEVQTGSTINGIYLKVEINATSSAALSNAYILDYIKFSENIFYKSEVL